MNDLTLLICDEEEEYTRLMAEYVLKQKGLRWKVRAYTDLDELLRQEGTVEGQEGDILLLSENALKKKVPSLIAKCTVLLSENGREAIPEQGYACIFKYQGADEVIRELLDIYAATGNGLPMVTVAGKSKVLAFYSPVHRCLQTTLALALGQRLAQKGRVLYLNFEYHAGMAGILPDGQGRDLADLVYFLNAEGEKFRLRLNSITRWYGALEYIPPMKVGQNLPCISREEWQRLIRRLDEEGEYDYLILDMSESMQGLYEILRSSSQVVTICRKDRMSTLKLTHYEQQLEMQCYKDVLDKTIKISLPFVRDLPEGPQEYTKGELSECVNALLQDIEKRNG